MNKTCSHSSCVISSLRGFRNGFYYGGRIRLMHSLVMTLLFRRGTTREKIINICEVTFEHAFNLGLFVFLYKSNVCLLNWIRQKSSKYHSLISGTICGYLVFRKKSNVNFQIILYILSRILVGFVEKLVKLRILPNWKAYPYFAAVVWAVIMFLFEDDASTLQPSLKNSMQFLYKDSDQYINITNIMNFDMLKSFGFLKYFQNKTSDQQKLTDSNNSEQKSTSTVTKTN